MQIELMLMLKLGMTGRADVYIHRGDFVALPWDIFLRSGFR
jgi:hypothetical protein